MLCVYDIASYGTSSYPLHFNIDLFFYKRTTSMLNFDASDGIISGNELSSEMLASQSQKLEWEGKARV